MPATKFRSLSARPYITRSTRQRTGTRGLSAGLDERLLAAEAQRPRLQLPELHREQRRIGQYMKCFIDNLLKSKLFALIRIWFYKYLFFLISLVPRATKIIYKI